MYPVAYGFVGLTDDMPSQGMSACAGMRVIMEAQKAYLRPNSMSVSFKKSYAFTRYRSALVMLRSARPSSGYANSLRKSELKRREIFSLTKCPDLKVAVLSVVAAVLALPLRQIVRMVVEDRNGDRNALSIPALSRHGLE